jgi:hypothetical protein
MRIACHMRSGDFVVSILIMLRPTECPSKSGASVPPSRAYCMVEVVLNPARGNAMRTNGGKDLGYKFGYRHQFGSITENYAKLLMGSHLWLSEITLDFAYLS